MRRVWGPLSILSSRWPFRRGFCLRSLRPWLIWFHQGFTFRRFCLFFFCSCFRIFFFNWWKLFRKSINFGILKKVQSLYKTVEFYWKLIKRVVSIEQNEINSMRSKTELVIFYKRKLDSQPDHVKKHLPSLFDHQSQLSGLDPSSQKFNQDVRRRGNHFPLIILIRSSLQTVISPCKKLLLGKNWP